jgi:creatinine amidohydrolase
MHAGELELSFLLHARPDVVRETYRTGDWLVDRRPHLLTTGMQDYTACVIGRPSAATAEKGRLLLESFTRSFKDHLQALDSHNSDFSQATSVPRQKFVGKTG